MTDLEVALDNALTERFEDNIVMQFGAWSNKAAHEGLELRQRDGELYKLASRYKRMRSEYLDAVADLIRYPDALDYLD